MLKYLKINLFSLILSNLILFIFLYVDRKLLQNSKIGLSYYSLICMLITVSLGNSIVILKNIFKLKSSD